MWTWLLGTKAGLTVLLSTVLLVGATASYYGFKTHHFNRGVASCEAAQAKAVADKNIAQAKENANRNTVASEIAKGATKDAAKVADDITKKTAATKEDIRNEYKAPPRTAPVAYNSCVRAVAPRVQNRIGAAVDSANGK